jgi:hypothetical protein
VNFLLIMDNYPKNMSGVNAIGDQIDNMSINVVVVILIVIFIEMLLSMIPTINIGDYHVYLFTT